MTLKLNDFLDIHFFSLFEQKQDDRQFWMSKPAFKIWNAAKGIFETKTNQELLELLQLIAHQKECHSKPRFLIISAAGFFSMAAMLAAWYTGGHFIPVSKEQKWTTIEELIQLLNPDLILFEDLKESDSIKLNNWPEAWLKKTRIYNSDRKTKLSLNYEFNTESFPIKPKIRPQNDLAYIITTSGSTGKPKLIPVKDKQLLSYIQNISQLLPQDNVDGMLQTFPISFDPSIEDLIWALIKKAYLIPCDFKTLRYFEKFELPNQKLWWASTPSTGSQLLKLLIPEKKNATPIFKQIHHSFFMGEKLSYHFSHQWKKIFSQTEIYNLYGPAETTITISYFKVKNHSIDSGVVPIGKIHPHHQSFLNEQSELVISGPQVIENYLFNPSDSFTPAVEPIEFTSFNTHDICSIHEFDYTLIGRSDHMVKINGMRFEPEEMETFLESHNISGVVIPVEDANSEVKLFLAIERNDINKESINQLIQNRYGIAFLIKKVVCLDALPKNKNLKIDRKKIKEIILALEAK